MAARTGGHIWSNNFIDLEPSIICTKGLKSSGKKHWKCVPSSSPKRRRIILFFIISMLASSVEQEPAQNIISIYYYLYLDSLSEVMYFNRLTATSESGDTGTPIAPPQGKGIGWSLSSGRIEGSTIDRNSQQHQHTSCMTELDLGVVIGRTTLSSLLILSFS